MKVNGSQIFNSRKFVVFTSYQLDLMIFRRVRMWISPLHLGMGAATYWDTRGAAGGSHTNMNIVISHLSPQTLGPTLTFKLKESGFYGLIWNWKCACTLLPAKPYQVYLSWWDSLHLSIPDTPDKVIENSWIQPALHSNRQLFSWWRSSW